MKYSEAGKGSAPRKAQDRDAYASGWDRIFGVNREKGNNQDKDAEAKESPDSNADGKEVRQA